MSVLSKTIELRNHFFSSKKSTQHRHEVLLRSGCHMIQDLHDTQWGKIFSKETFLSYSFKLNKNYAYLLNHRHINLKVSKFRKPIMVPKLLPKNKSSSLSWKVTTSRLIQKRVYLLAKRT